MKKEDEALNGTRKGKTFYHRFDTPMGEMVVAERAGKLCFCSWLDDETESVLAYWSEDEAPLRPALVAAKAQLEEYFAGKRHQFDLPLLLEGTPFQQKAWQVLQQIPYGEVITYGEEARRMDNPKAVRAVGGANHNNPIAIIVPCHRVVAAGGKLGGYGGGTDRKRFLLSLEGVKSCNI